MSAGGLDDFSMWELFRMEVQEQARVLSEDLVGLEGGGGGAGLERLMRAAHSLKGAARMVDAAAAVRVAHAMEDTFVQAQRGEAKLNPGRIDLLLEGVDLLTRLSMLPEGEGGGVGAEAEADRYLARLSGSDDPPPAPPTVDQPPGARDAAVVRVDAEVMDRMLGFAAESFLRMRALGEVVRARETVRRAQRDSRSALERCRERLMEGASRDEIAAALGEVERRTDRLRDLLAAEGAELEAFQFHGGAVHERLYQEILRSRMRPFGDVTGRLPRMVRDLARSLGKSAKLEIRGEETLVDRDILGGLETSLTHLLRNSVDHGIETPAEREGSGKAVTGTIRLEARHQSGRLLVTLEDDGRGIDPEALRAAVVRRGHTTAAVAANLSDTELLEFLFLPGLSLAGRVTELSGRGVGLDAVHATTRQAGGRVLASSRPGSGARFELLLPVTLSVIRALIVQVAGDVLAFPLARVERVLTVAADEIESVEGRQHVESQGARIGLVAASQLFGLPDDPGDANDVHLLVIGGGGRQFGLRVDRFLGERELVVRPLDPRLGSIAGIAAAALMPDLTPVLIADADDVLRAVELLISERRLRSITTDAGVANPAHAPRVLVVDDSLTVRELERKLLAGGGYAVDVAVDGMDGWHNLRATDYDLVITDVDMPRLDGIELVRRIRADARLRRIPVLVVSYKDREEDRLRGLEAGADRYLGKSSFHDQSLLDAVAELIGRPELP